MKILAALFLTALTTCLSAVESAEQSQPQVNAASESGKTIPFEQLGVEAQKQYSGDGIAITPTATGAQLRTVFQKLEGQATPEGLWLTSTREEDNAKAERFRVLAAELGRHQGHVDHQVRIQREGTVNATAESATFVRAGLTEEYRVSMDGVRQDFIVTERPSGEGALSVVLEVTGAKATAASYGAKLTLTGSGREIAYSRLHVTDATGRELAATLEVLSAGLLAVRVDDAGATYPVRIDPTFSDANWVSLNPGIPGANNPVYAAVVDGSDNLYIGGEFTFVGTVAANYIAKWNGSAWSALGTGMNGIVHALAVSGTDLYAGGEFAAAGGVAVNFIAKWDGSAWSALDMGMYGQVYSLAASGTDLYVGGNFAMAGEVAASNIAKWDGSAWSALGSGMSRFVFALAVSGADLYAGGSFTEAGGVTANYVAKWNGSEWSALGAGVNHYVIALAVSGSDLYVGGDFTEAGGVTSNSIAKWDGSAWSALGSGMNGPVYALTASGNDLYAGGGFITAGGVTANRIAKWNGSTWSALGTGVNDSVYALVVSGSDLYAGGWLTTAGGVNGNRIAKWDGSAWSALGSGMDAAVQALAVSGTDLYAGGWFTTAGGVTANKVAKWNGSVWTALGTGVNDDVNDLTLSGSDLYVGGDFTMAGGVTANRIAKWNGSTWSALGDGMNSSVNVLVVNGNDLYAGGWFATAGGVAASHIAKWDGSAWSALGSGIGGPVYALGLSGGDLYAGGGFATAGGVSAKYIAKWDGSAWSALGTGMDSIVTALAADAAGHLYLGGQFSIAGSTASPYIVQANLSVPTVTTSAVSNFLLTGVTLNGTVNPEGYTTAARFEYGLTTSYGSNVSVALSPNNGITAQSVSLTLSGLLPGTLYHYRLSATNAGTTTTTDATFTTLTNHAPVAAVGGPYRINPGQGITFDGSGSTDVDTLYGDSIASYQWDIDNNGTYDFTGGTVALTSAQLTTFGISNPGNYTIKLGVTDSFGLTGTTTGGSSSTLTVNTPQEAWRQLHFGITGNTGNAADSFDFDKDGLINLVEWGLGLDPTQGDTSQLPVAQKTGSDFVMSFTQPAGVSGITYGAEWSATLLANDWHPVADTGTGGQHIFSVPVGSNTKLFMRLVITSP